MSRAVVPNTASGANKHVPFYLRAFEQPNYIGLEPKNTKADSDTLVSLLGENNLCDSIKELSQLQKELMSSFVRFNDNDFIPFQLIFRSKLRTRIRRANYFDLRYLIPSGVGVEVRIFSFRPDILNKFTVWISGRNDSSDLLFPNEMVSDDSVRWIQEVSRSRLAARIVNAITFRNEKVSNRWIPTELVPTAPEAIAWFDAFNDDLAPILIEILAPRLRASMRAGSLSDFYILAYMTSVNEGVEHNVSLRIFLYIICVLYKYYSYERWSADSESAERVRRLLMLSYVAITEGTCSTCLFNQVDRIYSSGTTYPSPYDLFSGDLRGSTMHNSGCR